MVNKEKHENNGHREKKEQKAKMGQQEENKGKRTGLTRGNR